MMFVRLDQDPGEYVIRISANVFPQKISGYAGQSTALITVILTRSSR